MELMRLIFTIAIFMALSITLTMKIVEEEENPHFEPIDNDTPKLVLHEKNNLLMPSKRISRFLAEEKTPRASSADHHCKKDNKVCFLQGTSATTCCNNNKCIDLKTDKQHCGKCNKKCGKYTDVCCRGECVNLVYDKRHCGQCNNRCKNGGLCLYGMCEYA